MCAATESPSLVIIDVDGEKRYRLASDKAIGRQLRWLRGRN